MSALTIGMELELECVKLYRPCAEAADEEHVKKMDFQEFEKYRREFPITQSYTFMNHAAVSPVPCRVMNAVDGVLKELMYKGSECYPEWLRTIGETRRLVSRLVNSETEEIAFVPNTSSGLSTIAQGIKWKGRDEVLIPEPDFPANVYPWMNLEKEGVSVGFIKRRGGRLGPREIEEALSPRTRLITVSSADFFTGSLCDLAAVGEFCRTKGLLLCVDAIQSLGVIPMDVRKYGIHFLSAAGHKWLLSPPGCGFMFISREVNDLIHPEIVGWKSVVDEEDFFKRHFHLKSDVSRFEPGTMNMPGIAALGEAIRFLLEVGIEEVCQKVFATNDLLRQGLEERKIEVLSPADRQECSGILTFIAPSDGRGLFRYLARERIVLSLRGGNLRLSPHFYNNLDDVEHFFEALDSSGEIPGT